MEWFLKIWMFPARVRYRWRNRRRRHVSDDLARSIVAHYDDAERVGVKPYLAIYNATLFVVLLEQDLSGYAECVMFARNEWLRKFHSRNLAVLLFEASNDLPSVLGKDFRRALAEVAAPNGVIATVNSSVSAIAQFKRHHATFLEDIRTVVGAHRDHNARLQAHMLNKVEFVDILKLSAKLSKPIIDLTECLGHLLGHIHQARTMLKHVAKAVDEQQAAEIQRK